METGQRVASQKEVTIFLFEFKKRAGDNGRKIRPTRARYENNETIVRLGINYPQVYEKILDLTYKNFYRGPYKCEERPGNILEFGLRIGELEIYIKLCDDFSTELVYFISFHEAKEPIKYPY